MHTSLARDLIYRHVPITHITLHRPTIKALQKALAEHKDRLGLYDDPKIPFTYPLTPKAALDVLTVLPPIIRPIGKEMDRFSLIARLWQFDLIHHLQQTDPDLTLCAAICTNPAHDVLARLYSTAAFAGRCEAVGSDLNAQLWQFTKLTQAFQDRHTDKALREFLGKTSEHFQAQRKAQNDRKRLTQKAAMTA